MPLVIFRLCNVNVEILLPVEINETLERWIKSSAPGREQVETTRGKFNFINLVGKCTPLDKVHLLSSPTFPCFCHFLYENKRMRLWKMAACVQVY